MSDAPPTTFVSLIEDAVDRLSDSTISFGHGTDNPEDEAISLVLWALKIPHRQFDEHLARNDIVSEQDATRALAAINTRLSSALPAPYITGTAWLHGLAFDCDPRALIPRSLLVEALTESLPDWMSLMHRPQSTKWPQSILDLCCGSASIAIHAALNFPNASVVAADVSADALAVANNNVQIHDVANRVELIESNLYEAIEQQEFDLIVCNPPYVNDQSMAELPAEFRAEPDIALRGGSDGMDLIKTIVSQAPKFMKPNGLLLLEIGHEAPFFESRFERLEFSYLSVHAGDQMVVVVSREQLVMVQA